MHQSFETIAATPTPTMGMVEGGRANVQGSDVLSSPSVPSSAGLVTLCKMHTDRVYYSKERGQEQGNDFKEVSAVQNV